MGGGSVTASCRTKIGQGNGGAIESLKTFGISAEEGKRIIHRMGDTLLSENEKLFDRYWRQVFGPPRCIKLMHLLGKGLSIRVSQSPTGGKRLCARAFPTGCCIRSASTLTGGGISSFNRPKALSQFQDSPLSLFSSTDLASQLSRTIAI